MMTTTLTIELSQEVYHRLHTEAQRQGKADKILVEEILADQLLSKVDADVPLYLSLLPQIRAISARTNIDDLVFPGNTFSPEETIGIIRSWPEEDDDENEESWDDVLCSIDANRTSLS